MRGLILKTRVCQTVTEKQRPRKLWLESPLATEYRESTLKRWATHLQKDFKARMDWCVTDFQGANHPPVPRVKEPRVKEPWVKGTLRRTVTPGDTVTLDADESTDPDGDNLQIEWIVYPEAGSYRGAFPTLHGSTTSQVSFVVPKVESVATIHVLLVATDDGAPPLTRYQRVIVTVDPQVVLRLPQDN